MRRILNRFRDWLDGQLDMHLDFSGDLMTPDWSDGDDHEPATRQVAYMARIRNARRAAKAELEAQILRGLLNR